MRKFNTVSGIALLGFFVSFSVFGDPFAEPLLAVLVLAFGLAGALFLLGGLIDGFSLAGYRVHWYVFSGSATAIVGLSLSVSLFLEPSLDGAGAVFIRIVAVANALLFGYMGFDMVRGGGRADPWTSQESSE
ncbi:hypothetical protein [Halalkalicoccus tibetensis]|uniref:DUF308 domain-containing protein n=1 Tax=Halalkalicoccus tibetensis TaxID=175632 RepID=A0ABD5V3I2_9EURY